MRAALLTFVLALLTTCSVSAQAPHPLPASLHAAVGLPGRAAPRFANVTLELGSGEWRIVGCIASVAGACAATETHVLDAERRATFVRLWQEVASMPRCEPAGFVPGDPEYTVDTATTAYRGHLPASLADLPRRLAGTCLADARLAWWLAQQLGA